MNRPEISLCVLCYDDAPALPALLHSFHQALGAAASRFEILVVDDGSEDDTADVVAGLVHTLDSIRILRHDRNRGVGAGFRTGWQAARYDFVGYTDGDGQYDARDLPAMIEALDRVDAVSGQRVRRADPFHRTLVSGAYNFLLHVIYGLPLADANSGLKLYRRRFLEAVGVQRSNGSFFDAEILIKGLRAGCTVGEIPIRHWPRQHGRARGISLPSVGNAFRGLVEDFMRPYVRPDLAARMSYALLRRFSAGSSDRNA